MLYNLISNLNLTILDENLGISDQELNVRISERNTIKSYCENKIKQYLPKLNKNETNNIILNLTPCLYYLKNGLNIEANNENSELDIFLKQISMNNDRNFLAIVNMILPYLDDKNDI